MLKVNDLIEQLQEISNDGYGGAQVVIDPASKTALLVESVTTEDVFTGNGTKNTAVYLRVVD